MKGRKERAVAAAAAGGLLILLSVVGLGCMNVTRLRNVEGLYDELYHVAWIPWLVMGLAVIGCLALLGALRPLKPQNPLNYAPALAYLPLLVSELGKAVGGALSSMESREPLFTANKLQLALFFLSGAVGLLAARRGRRGAGIFLTALGVALVGLFFFTILKDRTAPVWEDLERLQLPAWTGMMAARAYEGLILYTSMSAYGFVFFAGIKCLLPERRIE